MANHSDNEWEFAGEKYTCKPGQFITSLDGIVEKAGKGISKQNVRTSLKRFEKLEFLTNQSTQQNRLITICNWENYQDKNDGTNIEANRCLTDDQQTTNRGLTTNKNDKNEEEGKEGEEIIMPEEKIPAYSLCMKIYNDFILEKLGVKAKIDGTQGKALKSIIKYLKSNIKEKPASKQAICDAFEIIFQKYDRWGKFYQGQLKLNQIDSNLINIIKLIKNGKSTEKGCSDADIVAIFANTFGTN